MSFDWDNRLSYDYSVTIHFFETVKHCINVITDLPEKIMLLYQTVFSVVNTKFKLCNLNFNKAMVVSVIFFFFLRERKKRIN